MLRRVALGIVVIIALLVGALFVVFGGGESQAPGTPSAGVVAESARVARLDRQRAITATATKQILFGDLHVHTTYSADAFLLSLPLMGGEGARPPADACDFARFCADLDFFSVTDHAEALTPKRWRELKESTRQCNAVAGDKNDPDIVAFPGWEWTQVGVTAAVHYGHKNVIFRDDAEDQLPPRPIAAPGVARVMSSVKGFGVDIARMALIPVYDFERRQRYLDLATFQREAGAVTPCPADVPTKDLPVDCRETAMTPGDLFARLNDWGFDSIVIPHGTSWGFYTPPEYEYASQLAKEHNDTERQRLIEVYSGHGNSEEYRPWRHIERIDGKQACPDPTEGFEPCCWRAGEIVREQCESEGLDDCDAAAAEARAAYVAAGTSGHATLPWTYPEDWLDCGLCRDCFTPAFNYRPGGSTQAILARGGIDAAKLGFIASSDNHRARPGTGYKEVARRGNADVAGPESKEWLERLFVRPPPKARADAIDGASASSLPPILRFHVERQASFFLTGGLVAVHSPTRDRDAIWSALHRREVYGTSGPRMLLWFDLEAEDERRHPMGSEVDGITAPTFEVTAAGAFEQKPGCPEWTTAALGQERLQDLCLGECYHPGDTRTPIDHIEVVRIRPHRSDDERLEDLIDDPFRRLPCPSAGPCTVRFSDPSFAELGRDAIYYVRAVQRPTDAINGDDVRCERDADGKCVKVRPCHGDYRVPFDDDCVAPVAQRAWSSPIFVRAAPQGGE